MPSIVKPCLAWPESVRLLIRWLAEKERVDVLMEDLPAAMAPVERARCQHLVYGVIRNAGRIEAVLDRLIAHPPRFVTRAILYALGFELLEAGSGPAEAGKDARIVHHAVEQAKGLASPAEARLVNAVGRKLAGALGSQAAPGKLATAEALADYFSHPAWLVRRWLTQHGAAATRALLEWNQTPAPLYARRRPGVGANDADWLKPTRWEGFVLVEGGHWPEVEQEIGRGALFVQDPSTRIAVDAMEPKGGETWLDACAAPGGKSLLIADRAGEGRLIAADVGGSEPDERKRIARLAENIGRVRGVRAEAVEIDLLGGAKAGLERRQLPGEFDAVLVDAPCTNTGVMRHRIDVKWRLQEGDFRRHGRRQLALLNAAAGLVKPGGRLVYSTCSIDPEENEQVAAEFLQANASFRADGQWLARPWEAGHDGAGVFRFRRT